MPISQTQLAARWELSKARISQLVAQGMPMSSVEDAERWRAERHMETGHAPASFLDNPDPALIGDESGGGLADPEPDPLPGGETFSDIIESQRRLIQMSRREYIKAVKGGSPQQSKLYASYDKTVNTLTKLKAEADRLSVFSREYIRATDAAEAMREFAAEVVNRLDKAALDLAESCNPENPAKAVKALTTWSHKVRKELSKDE